MDTLTIKLPTPSDILEGNINLTHSVKSMAETFLSLSMDASFKEIENKLHELLLNFNQYFCKLKRKSVISNITKLQEEHEQYFDIIRYKDSAGDLIIGNIIDSYFKFISDCQLGHNLSAIDLGHINGALRSLTQYILSRKGEANDE